MNEYAKAFGTDIGNILMEAMNTKFKRPFKDLSPEEQKDAFLEGEIPVAREGEETNA